MSLSTCSKCGGHIPLGPHASNRCESCGAGVFDDPPGKLLEPTHAMIKAAIEDCARDDEGEFPSLGDHLNYSGENKTYTVVRSALRAALRAAP